VTERLITVAIHTYDHARALESLLEKQGVEVTLQNVNLSEPTISPGIRVRIKESDLPIALRIIENKDIFVTETEPDDNETPDEILVPVDFSDYSLSACKTAIHLAAYHKATITLLHTYINPVYALRAQLSDVLNFNDDIEENNKHIAIQKEANILMNNLAEDLRNDMKAGNLPVVKFTALVSDGVPEEVINQYAKDHHPLLIVMGTRGVDVKEREMVGSVTAEVLDTCRQPIFTIPGSIKNFRTEDKCNVVFFSNFDQEDILALDALFHLLPITPMNVKLIKLPSKKQVADPDLSLKTLKTYCDTHYLQHKFIVDSISINNIDEDFDRISESYSIDLIAVPSKKKNVLARLFNPGIAHRLLFHSDIPMMVIPV